MSQSSQTLSTFTYAGNKQYLFSRTYAISIGAPNQTSALQYSNVQVPVNGQVLPASPLRVTFDISKNMAGTSNKSKFEIYNLSIQTRSKLRAGYLVQLQAGYRGLMNTIFVGNVDMKGAGSERKGPDIITTLECGEGESAIVMSRLDKSYPAGTNLYQILQDLASAMNASSVTTDGGINAGLVLGIPSFTYGRGITLHGSCKESLDKLLKPFGLRWSVQNGGLNIVPVKQYNGTQAIVVASGSVLDNASGVATFNPNNATGLIGTPSRSDYYTKFKSLLNPNIIPGCLVQLICENNALNGFYKVLTAHYMGDTHDNKWEVECECTPISAQVTVPTSQGLNFSTAVVA